MVFSPRQVSKTTAKLPGLLGLLRVLVFDFNCMKIYFKPVHSFLTVMRYSCRGTNHSSVRNLIWACYRGTKLENKILIYLMQTKIDKGGYLCSQCSFLGITYSDFFCVSVIGKRFE